MQINLTLANIIHPPPPTHPPPHIPLPTKFAVVSSEVYFANFDSAATTQINKMFPDGGQLFLDYKKRLERLKFIHLASTFALKAKVSYLSKALDLGHLRVY